MTETIAELTKQITLLTEQNRLLMDRLLRMMTENILLHNGVVIFHVARMCKISVQMINDIYGHVADEKTCKFY